MRDEKAPRFFLQVLLMAIAGVIPLYAGSTVVGSLAEAKNATVDGERMPVKAALFSGNSLQVADGVAMVTLGKGSRIVLGEQTEVSLERKADEVTVLLERGNVLMLHPAEENLGLQVKVADVTISPELGFRTIGEVAMYADTLAIVGRAGSLRIRAGGKTVELRKGKAMTIRMDAAATPDPQQPPIGRKVPPVTPRTQTIIQIGTVGVGVTAFAFAISAGNDASSAADRANQAAANLQTAQTALAQATPDAQAAQAAAAQAAADAAAACRAVSPTNPNCPP